MKSKLLYRIDRSTKFAILCGILCAICVVAYMLMVKAQANASQKEAMEKYGGNQVEVCVAKRDIAGGEAILDSDVEIKTWISSLLPENAITTKDECVGKKLGSSIVKGEVVTKTRMETNTSVIDVPEGMDAVCIPLDDTSSVGGSLRAGMKIDLYATGNNSTTKICKEVQILETSSSNNDSSSQSRWITIAVLKDKVQEVVAAVQKLELYVVLPSEGSEKEAEEVDIA